MSTDVRIGLSHRQFYVFVRGTIFSSIVKLSIYSCLIIQKNNNNTIINYCFYCFTIIVYFTVLSVLYNGPFCHFSMPLFEIEMWPFNTEKLHQ